MDRDLRLHQLLRELDDCGVALRLERGRLHVQHGAKLTAELCDEINELRAELVEYLSTQGEEVVDYTAGDAEGKSHSDMRTLPRTPEDAEKRKADADRVREAGRRRYQGGMLLVNDPDGMRYGAYIKQLAKADERRQAIERGELPPEGYYQRKWDIFG